MATKTKKQNKKVESIKKKYSTSQSAPQSRVYKEEEDKKRVAKPVGYRFTDKLAKKLKVNPLSKPTTELIEKYKNKGIYFEKRVDKSDINYRKKLEHGGFSDMNKLTMQQFEELVNKYKKENKPFIIFLYSEIEGDIFDKFVIDKYASLTLKYTDIAFNGKMGVIDFLDEEDKEDFFLNNSKEFFEYCNKIIEKEVDYFIDYYIHPNYYFVEGKEQQARDILLDFMNEYAEIKPLEVKYDIGKAIESLADAGVIIEKINYQFAKGGKTSVFGGRYSKSPYNEEADGNKTAKPVGYRYTDYLAKKLHKDKYSKPSIADIQKYKGHGIYFEDRQDKADINPSRKYISLETGGEVDEEIFASGGVVKIANRDARTYTENLMNFNGNHLEGKRLENGDYVVLSYGYYPIFFWSASNKKWYGNKSKKSTSTAKHISQSRPSMFVEYLNRDELEDVMFKSRLGELYDENKIDYEENV